MSSAAKAKGKAKAKADAKAKGKATAKANAKTKQGEEVKPSLPWGKILGSMSSLIIVGLIAWGVYGMICVLEDWTPWSPCMPAVEGAPQCEQGVQSRTRKVVKGSCGGAALRHDQTCEMGPCVQPDLLMNEEKLPCNLQSKEQILQIARRAYDQRVWSALEQCKLAYLCCYDCEDISTMAAPLTCGKVDIPTRPLTTSRGCVSCFATVGGNNSGLTGCEASEPLCQLGKGLVTSDADRMCCFSVGPQPLLPGEGVAPVPGAPPKATLDETHFERHPDKDAFIGELHQPDIWPVVANEAECQLHCWRDSTCYIYTFISQKSLVEQWRGHCVTLDMDLAEQIGREDKETWVTEEYVFSGIKASVSYSTVIVTVRTAEDLGSNSNGPFHVVICASPDDCEDRSPIVLTSTNCRRGEDCLKEGHTSEFVSLIAVPHDFQLHLVKFSSYTDDMWNIDRVVVNIEGQIGTHHEHVAFGGDNTQFSFAVGCVTEEGYPCTTECFPGGDGYGWCYTDEQQSLSGNCVEACKTSGVASTTQNETSSGDARRGSAMSCAELNWATTSPSNRDHEVCGSSSDDPLPGCSGVVTWMQGRDFCEAAGARFCTQQELEDDETAGSGCSLDQMHVWSSTPCKDGDLDGYMVVPGASSYRKLGLESECSLKDVDTVEARCCADSHKLVMAFTRTDRDTHELPDGFHIRSHGGLGNWLVVAGTTHSDQPGFFLQSGMLYDQAPVDSDELEISLDEVPVSPRGGQIEFYFRIDSEPAQDQLHFFIDDQEQTSGGFPVSGRIPWTLARFSFPSKPNVEFHSFRWLYRKDRSVSEGTDVASVDEITIRGVLANC
mmetsp:Transcript_80670/g.261449  ORF Transcript_80670/g.261449 Transcript_80670/m.261449 type:complete len:834 (-) Transcript_80670:69-2570(-)